MMVASAPDAGQGQEQSLYLPYNFFKKGPIKAMALPPRLMGQSANAHAQKVYSNHQIDLKR